MKLSAVLTGVFVVLVAFFIGADGVRLAGSSRRDGTSQSAQSAAGKGWEYATLTYSEGLAGKPWHWSASGKVLADGDAAEIMKLIGGQTDPAWRGQTGLVAQAGSQGWEIVMITPHGAISDFWFKRPVR